MLGRAQLALALLLRPVGASADAGEWCVGAGGGTTVLTVQTAGADGTAFGYAGRGRVSYGVTNTLELGVLGQFAHASDIEFSNAVLEGQMGRLYVDASAISVGAEIRWTPGVGMTRAFARTSPYVAGRLGGTLRILTSQDLLNDRLLILVEAKDDFSVAAFAGGALGLTHRFGDHVFASVDLAALFTVSGRQLDGTLELAWSWY